MKQGMKILALTLVLALAFGSVAFAQGMADTAKAKTQINTAIQHAQFSLNQSAHGGALTHLRHVLNCIEGSGGANFNQSWGYPCNNQGSGIVVDLGSGSAAALIAAAANDIAAGGIGYQDLESVHAAAAAVKALLEQIAATL